MDDRDLLLGELKSGYSNLEKVSNDHEIRIRAVEDITGLITKISENVEKQGNNIDKLTKMFEQSQIEMVMKAKEAQLKTELNLYIKIHNILKKVNWKKVIVLIAGVIGAGGITASIVSLFI